MKKNKRIILFLALMFWLNIILQPFSVLAQETDPQSETKEVPQELSNLYAQSAVLMDADSGRILFGKNETKVMPMASTTKIMTCILVLENTNLREEATVSELAQSQPKVHLGVVKDEKYYVEDLLYSLMLESHNDSAVILAEHVAGNVEAFADLMNEKAKEIGCSDTYFITPNGLDASDENGVHATTASDLARIMRYCISISEKREEFLRITRTASYQFTDVSGSRSFSCTNHNAFLNMMECVLSGKTGFTADAGYCYVGALRQGEETYIVALLACGWPNNKSYKWSDTQKLMTYGLENFSYQNIWEEVDLPDIIVGNTIDMTENAVDDNELEMPVEIKNPPEELNMLISENEEPRIELEIKKKMEAPVKKGETVGVIRYWISDDFIGEWEVISCKKMEEKSYWKLLVKITKKALIS